MPEEPDERRRLINPIALTVLLVVVLPVLYVASIGPVVAIVEKTNAGREVALVLYAPVVWLHEHTPLKEPLEWYAELWGWN